MVRLAVIHRFEVGIAGPQRLEEPAPVGNHPVHRSGLAQDFVGGAALEHVQVPHFGVAVHLAGIQDADDNALRQPLDVPGQRLAVGAGSVPGAEPLRVTNAQSGQGAGLQGIQNDARHHERPERRAPPRLVEAKYPAIPRGGRRIR